MSKEVLLLRLEGPLQSWSCRLRSETQGGGDYPTKSGIVRLLASALGMAPGDPKIASLLEAGLRFGVRVEFPGKTVRDEVAQSDGTARPRAGAPKKNRRQNPRAQSSDIRLSPKEYMQDASFLVALEAAPGAPPDLIARCAASLVRPAGAVYLGRRSCPPTRPVFEQLTAEFEGIEDALMKRPWAWENDKARLQIYSQDLIAYIEEPNGQSRPPCNSSGCSLASGTMRCVRRIIVPMSGLMPQKD